ncbi:tRNA (adenosine(37)-N6)-threonylcarbamoyltransferase complex ATPase subunit type 1 TsaE [bacterium]|nr:tRNA (adenosine(37)-N6)-threonylcarbamoyltransferase complex ATPase subunit type 1 TsaE [bacterium]
MDNTYITLYSKSPLETEEIGKIIGKISEGRELFLLLGDLGAGKTVLVKGIAKGLGIDAQIVSPTFIIIKNYPGRLTLNHIDLYRINSIEGLGIEEYIDDDLSVTVVEWGEKLIDSLRLKEYLLVKIEITDDNSRKITLVPKGERYIRFIERIREWQT